jgi:hypothetical protein
MNWKSYTLVSGAGVLATWFAASQPQAPGRVQPAQPREAAGAAAAASDIEQQAARLQARLQNAVIYREPERNLFRFAERPAPSPATTPAAGVTPVVEPFVAPPLPLKLTGVAADREGEGATRTAVLGTPDGVVLAREGDTVLERYRVTKIEEEAVELVTIADGVAVRLTLR